VLTDAGAREVEVATVAEQPSPSGDLLGKILARIARIEAYLATVHLLVAQSTDPTHLSIEGAARALGVSVKTVRRRIAAGTLTLETIPGSNRRGIAIDAVYRAGWWVPLAVARAAVEEERGELARLKDKNR
jgi:hypothetical protein